jgi:hypothetical protein
LQLFSNLPLTVQLCLVPLRQEAACWTIVASKDPRAARAADGINVAGGGI